MGGKGYEISALLGYRIDRLMLSIRPAFLRQQTSAFRQLDDDGGMNFRKGIYPSAFLLPLRADLNFGNQKLRPALGVGTGELFSPGRSNANQDFGGQRWGYAAIGLVVSN